MTLPPSPLHWLIDTSLRVSAAMVLLILLRPWLRRILGSNGVALLWVAVMLRLLLPWPVASRWSVANWWPVPHVAQSRTADPSWQVRVSAAPPASPLPAGVPTMAPRGDSLPSSRSWWTLLWLLGVIPAVANLTFHWRKTRRCAARTSPGRENTRLSDLFESIPAALRRGVELRITDEAPVPTLAGMIRPQLWMPRAWLERLTTEELRHILLHELGHARRGDLLARWLDALACCLHWFNPLVWLAARLAVADRELACDAWVLARGKALGTHPAEYGHTLIKVVQWLQPAPLLPSPTTVTMANGKRGLSRRVGEIGAFRAVPPWRGGVAVALAVCTGLALTTTRSSSAQDTPPPLPPAAPASPVAPATPTPSPGATPPAREVKIFNQPQILVESITVAVSRKSLAQLKASNQQSPDSTGVFDQLIETFSTTEKEDASAPRPGVQMITRLIPPPAMDGLMRRINGLDQANILSMPKVTTQSGQTATVEIVREFLYPTSFDRSAHVGSTPITTPTSFEKKNLGFTLKMTPVISPDQPIIDLSVSWHETSLQGYMRPSTGRLIQAQPGDPTLSGDDQPVFTMQSVDTTVSVPPGYTVVLAGPRREPGMWQYSESSPSSEQLVLNFLTLSLVHTEAAKPEGSPVPRPPENATPKEEVSTPLAANETMEPYSASGVAPVPELRYDEHGTPYGVPVRGKPGFILSPFALDAGQIDTRGFRSGQEVRDPYTSKLLIIP